MSDFAQDESLLKELATGQDDVWQRFYDDHRSPFRLYFLRYTRMESEDVLALYHDVMVVMHRKVINAQLQAPLRSKLRTYLIGIGKVLVRKYDQSQPSWDDEIPEFPVAPSVEDKTEREAQVELVRRLLNQLDEGCRKVIELVYIHGYAMESVASQLDLPTEGAARKRKFDCLRKLRNMV